MKRREFIKTSVAVTTSLYLPGTIKGAPETKRPLVVKVTGDNPYQNAKRVIQELGGMTTFISKGDVVMVKPNIGWNRTVEQGANTNPEVLKAVIEMTLEAGAKKVIVMDNSCHKAVDTYRRSGIEEMARQAGAEVRFSDENRLVVHDFNGESLKRWPVFKDHLEVDKFINVPILKHHGSAGLTIGMKNLYGILGGNRGKLHRSMGTNISDLGYGFKTTLTIVDAYRVMLRNGPVGGRVSDVELKKTIIASTSIMDADVVAVNLFGEDPQKYDFIQAAFQKKMGAMDLDKINLRTVNS